MDFVTWTNEYKVGVAFIDADHRILVDLINQANACIDKREETATMASVLATLFDYTEYHFSREEKLMELSDYGGLGLHKIIHKSLAGQVLEIVEKFAENPENVHAVEVRDFLNNWLLEHISGHDFDYRDACLKNKAARQQAGAIRFMEEEINHNGAKGLENLSVMVVDDNKNFLSLVETILKALGIRRVQLLESATKFNQTAGRSGVLRLGHGRNERRRIRPAGQGHEITDQGGFADRLFNMTGYSIDVLQERSSSDAVEGYLEKPITAKRLLDSISSIAIN